MGRFLQLLRRPRRWSMVLLFVCLAGASWIYLSRVPQNANAAASLRASPQVGFLAPDLALETLDGRPVLLSALRGKVVLVNLWASWCPPCRAEMPAIDKVYQANRGRGLEVLAVDATYQDDEISARAFVRQLGLTFPVLLDRSGAADRDYLVRALPTSFFIDRRGVIRAIVPGGPMPQALIQSTVDELLAEAP